MSKIQTGCENCKTEEGMETSDEGHKLCKGCMMAAMVGMLSGNWKEFDGRAHV